MADIKLEAMLLHLLNSKSPNGKLWAAITVPGIGRFTRQDVEDRLKTLRSPAKWYQFWKK